MEGIKCWAGLRRQMPSIQLERSFGLTVSPRFRQDLSKLFLPTHSHQTFVAAPDVISAISIASLISHFTGQIRYDHHIQHRSFAETPSGCINVAASRASGKFFNGERPPNRYGLLPTGGVSLTPRNGCALQQRQPLLERIDSQKAAMESPSVDQPKPNMPRQPA